MKALTLLLLLVVENDIARIASQIDSTVGVAAVNLETGNRISIRGGERFPMGSVYKFPIAIEVLRQVDAGKLRLTDELKIQPWDFSTGHSPIRDNAKGKLVAQRKDGLTPASHDLMMRIMTSGPRNRIKAGLPENVSVAHKSGQMPGVHNDVGIVDGRIVIAVFTKRGVRSSEDLRGDVISKIARRVYDEITAPAARGSTMRQP